MSRWLDAWESKPGLTHSSLIHRAGCEIPYFASDIRKKMRKCVAAPMGHDRVLCPFDLNHGFPSLRRKPEPHGPRCIVPLFPEID